jgi:alpha-L-arabinofuranosidase
MIDAFVRLDLGRRLGKAQPLAFGQFIEHLGRCIYGGIFEPGSPLADESGFRRDVLAAIRALKPPVLRWPGGNFVSGYHWQDGVGPIAERPAVWDRAWRKIESNAFGTDEFIRYCRLLQTEPYLAVNMGSGDMDEAAAWLEYCNRPAGTRWADLRAKNGNQEPFGVHYWGLGNEVFGFWQIGNMSAEEYSLRAREFGKLMRLTDANISLVACGAHQPEWDWEVVKTAGRYIDYVSVHSYFRPEMTADPYYSLMARPSVEEEYIRDLHHLVRAARRQYGIERPISIAFDEWNVWYRTLAQALQPDSPLEEPYNFGDALCVAAFLNVLNRSCGAVGMANFAQTVNVLGAITTSPEGLILQPVYFPLLMQREHSGSVVLDLGVESDEFEITVGGQHRRVAYLDVCATLDEEDGKLFLSCVNFHHSERMRLRIRGVPPGTAKVHSLTAADADATNTFERPDTVKVTSGERAIGKDGVIELEAHSAHVIETNIKG